MFLGNDQRQPDCELESIRQYQQGQDLIRQEQEVIQQNAERKEKGLPALPVPDLWMGALERGEIDGTNPFALNG